MFGGLYFWVFDYLYFGGCNFLNSNLFLTSFSVSDVPTGRVQVLFRHQKQRNLPLDPACPEHLSDHLCMDPNGIHNNNPIQYIPSSPITQ